MAYHHVMHLIVLDMVRSDLTCVSAFAVGATVLSSDHDSRVHDGLDEGQVQESGKHHNVCRKEKGTLAQHQCD